MHTQTGLLAELTDTSLTDVILALCASGHFGVREAIAAALRQGPRRLGPDPADASTSSMFQSMPDTSGTPVIPGKRMKRARPGIQEHSVSAFMLSAPRYD